MDLIAGDYVAIVEDFNGCQATVDVTIAQIGGLIVDTVIFNHINCFGDTAGSVELMVSGGSGVYTFTLGDSTNMNGMFGSLSANEYTVLIEDNQGCQSQYMFSITQSDMITVTQDSLLLSHVACFGDTTGSVELMASGGSGIYAFTLGDSTNMTGMFDGLSANDYTVLIEDSQGCQSQYMFSITQPDVITVSQDSSITYPVGCFGDSTGYIFIRANGGSGPYTYTLDTTANMNGIFDNLPAGDHTVIVEDNNGCQEQFMYMITEPDQLVLTVDSIGSGYVRVISTGGTVVVFGYSIDGGLTFQGSGEFSGLSAGDYTIIVQDLRGCLDSIDVSIIVSNTANLDPAINAIYVYPNPTENELFIDLILTDTRSYTYHFYTLSGVLVKGQNSGTLAEGHHVLRVDLAQFTHGQYILQFVSDNGVFNRKIIKVK